MSAPTKPNTVWTAELETLLDAWLKERPAAEAQAALTGALRGLQQAELRTGQLWPHGGGECGELIRNLDWSATPLGPAERWSLELRATVQNILNSPVAKVLMWGPDHRLIYNDAYRDIVADRHPELMGAPTATALPEVWDWNRPILEAGYRGELVSHCDVTMVLDLQGSRRGFVFDLHYTPVYDACGEVGGVMCTVIDQTERVAMERRLAASNRRFRTAMNAVHGVLWTNSAEGRMLGEQPGWAALTGQAFEEYQDFGWAEAVHPDDQETSVKAWNEAVAAKSMFIHEHRVRDRAGAWRIFAIRALPILDETGEIEEWVGVHTDITHRRAAERALRQLNESLEARVISEIEERRKAEARLLRAQKLETVGKLTGGVAHDFNNLLQVVSGNLQLLAKDVAGIERAEKRVASAMAGVSRGARLAAQLLAFGRRQALEPKVVNISRRVQEMDDMMRRALGETVQIETVVGGGLWNTFIDPNQIENALLNLAVNARDAMNGEGKLTIELSNAHLDDDYARQHEEVTAGQYVMLAVTDTGSGMAPEIVDKVFEPFFSTKSEGKGSGLGLSMVYGFVKQSGGHIKIYSEVGHGTTIRLYLPRSMENEDVVVDLAAGPVAGGTETVLVVEDDEEVRATVIEMLSDLGYRVLKASDAGSALNVIESGIPIDLLFTDVVMPGELKSPELARKARARLPGIAVLFTSGYTENSIVHGGKLDAGVELLSKPYTRETLARKIRHVLGNEKQRGQASAMQAQPPNPEPNPEPESETELLPGPAIERAAVQPKPATVLLVEDDALIRMNTSDMLQGAGYVVIEAASAEEALATLRTMRVDTLLTDIKLPGFSGGELATQARELQPGIAVIYASGDASSVAGDTQAQVLTKPYGEAQLLKMLEEARAATAPAAVP
ncbi:response regulator [Bosea sp. (in: a-proteobacteria)]|uniref:response regulator n=1 Tax=Bosea sp. (in: a-proteobacteria) TaxID=1871050 RepID=UPI0012293E1F|nr:response regulator [Bosea sp. (in: a-proteobacteria)]TAJ27983.1 MAG: hybrid sensor histidine kinase/response regulator [Bosea sp. (in: a-proteobacteria)]